MNKKNLELIPIIYGDFTNTNLASPYKSMIYRDFNKITDVERFIRTLYEIIKDLGFLEPKYEVDRIQKLVDAAREAGLTI